MAAVPEIAGRFGTVIGVGAGRCRRQGLGQEPAGLGERLAKRAGAGGEPDEIEQIAVQLLGGIRPFPDRAGRLKAHEQGAARRAAHVAGAPVCSATAAVGQVLPAHVLGVYRQRGGGVGGIHRRAAAGHRAAAARWDGCGEGIIGLALRREGIAPVAVELDRLGARRGERRPGDRAAG